MLNGANWSSFDYLAAILYRGYLFLGRGVSTRWLWVRVDFAGGLELAWRERDGEREGLERRCGFRT